MNPVTLRCSILALMLVTMSNVLFSDDNTKLSREQIYNHFKTAYADGDWESARNWAGRLIEAKEREYGPDAPELIVSLINRAAVDLEVKDWESAQKHTRRGLTILKQQSDDNPQLRIALLLTEARAELGLRNEKLARESLYKALRLNKKSKPVDKWTEADIYQLLVEVAKREYDQRDGNTSIRNSLQSRAEFFGDDSIQMAPFYEDASKWYRWSSQFSEERKLHKRAIEIIEAHYGKDDIRLAKPLIAVAETYMIPRKSPKKVESALLRARELIFPNTTAATLIQAQVLVNLADFYVVFDDPKRGIDLYRESWNVMANHAEIGAANANLFFSETRRLYFNQPDKPASTGKGADYFAEGYVVLGFDVSRSGTLENVKILSSKPVHMKEKLFRDAARKARYRPRVVDGEPVTSLNESLRFNYDYRDGYR